MLSAIIKDNKDMSWTSSTPVGQRAYFLVKLFTIDNCTYRILQTVNHLL